jgi:hypothetical protein
VLKRISCITGLLVLLAEVASGERISNPVAIFVGLNKITGLTTNFEAKVGEAVAFEGFVVHAAVCYSRPITEAPKTTAFVQIDMNETGGGSKRVFSGWMFAESPGLNAVEDPVLDVWLTGCRDPAAPPPPVEAPKFREDDGTAAADTNPLD